jgi:flagellar basal-body rod protein FlgB
MINALDKELSFNRNALSLRGHRQEMIASNIANADTPHYKARDFDFKAALASRMSGNAVGDVQMQKTAAGHMDSGSAGMAGVNTLYRSEYQGSVDGNTVNMDIERGAFAENSVHVEAMLTFIREQVKTMNIALQN